VSALQASRWPPSTRNPLASQVQDIFVTKIGLQRRPGLIVGDGFCGTISAATYSHLIAKSKGDVMPNRSASSDRYSYSYSPSRTGIILGSLPITLSLTASCYLIIKAFLQSSGLTSVLWLACFLAITVQLVWIVYAVISECRGCEPARAQDKRTEIGLSPRRGLMPTS
jgi:hypothetical protein